MIESSLVLAYISFCVWLIEVERGAETVAANLRLSEGTLGNQGDLWTVVAYAFSQLGETTAGL